MAAAVLVRRDVLVVVCLWEGFEACDALIWTLCQQDVTFVGECALNKHLLKPKRLKRGKITPNVFSIMSVQGSSRQS
jgi:hypothetical protein